MFDTPKSCFCSSLNVKAALLPSCTAECVLLELHLAVPHLYTRDARARHTPSALQREDDLKLLSDAKLQQLSTLVTFCVTLRMLDYLQGVYEEYRCLFEMFYSIWRRSSLFCQRVELVPFYVRQSENIISNSFNYFSILNKSLK